VDVAVRFVDRVPCRLDGRKGDRRAERREEKDLVVARRSRPEESKARCSRTMACVGKVPVVVGCPSRCNRTCFETTAGIHDSLHRSLGTFPWHASRKRAAFTATYAASALLLPPRAWDGSCGIPDHPSSTVVGQREYFLRLASGRSRVRALPSTVPFLSDGSVRLKGRDGGW